MNIEDEGGESLGVDADQEVPVVLHEDGHIFELDMRVLGILVGPTSADRSGDPGLNPKVSSYAAKGKAMKIVSGTGGLPGSGLLHSTHVDAMHVKGMVKVRNDKGLARIGSGAVAESEDIVLHKTHPEIPEGRRTTVVEPPTSFGLDEGLCGKGHKGGDQ